MDPALESTRPEDPQTWNRYAYTSNNPVNRVDPDCQIWFVKDGEEPIWVDPDEKGNYVSPGEGWTMAPNGYALVLGDQVIRSGVGPDGQPTRYVQEPGLIDNTDDFVGLAQTARIGAQLFRGSLSLLKGGAAKAGLQVGGTELRKNMVIAGYRVGNHAARKSGVGRKATVELVEATISGARSAGTIISEAATGKFAGNQILKYTHQGATVVVDESRRVIMSVRGAGLAF